MYMTNEEWEQNNQDYLKESYEETGFTTGGYAIRKLICGGCGLRQRERPQAGKHQRQCNG